MSKLFLAEAVTNAFAQEGKTVENIEYVPSNWMDKLWYDNITHPMQMWFNDKLYWLKVNSIDLIEVIALAIIVSVALKMFIYKKKSDVPVIYFTVVIYTILRLFWRVVLHV